MQRRKKIDNFLIELEKYCVDNQLKQINGMDFYMFLQDTGDTKIMNSLGCNKRIIKLPNLCIFLNGFRMVSNNLNKSTGKIYTRTPIKATGITEYSMRRIAYSLEWIEVKEINYKHFFDKHSFNSLNVTDLEAECISKDWIEDNIENKILVPKDFFYNKDLYLFKK